MLIRVLISKCDDSEDRDVTIMTSHGHVTLSVSNRRTVCIFLGSVLDTNPLNCLVSEIFSITVADTQTDTHTEDKSTDDKGRLKLAEREPKLLYVYRRHNDPRVLAV